MGSMEKVQQRSVGKKHRNRGTALGDSISAADSLELVDRIRVNEFKIMN